MAIASVEREGVKLSCRATGARESGRAALLIHGLNTNMAFWHPLLVRRLGVDRQVLLYDQRGHGYSDMPKSGYRLNELAEDARAVLDSFAVDAADVVAHSFGAGVALALARRYPQRVRSLVILDGRLRSIQPEVRLADWAHFARWKRQFDAAGIAVDPNWEIDCTLPLRLEGVDFSQLAAGLSSDGFFVPRVHHRAAAKYRRLLTETGALAEYQDPHGLTPAMLGEVRQPTLLCYGTVSPFLSTCDTLAAVLPEARVEILEGAGHNFPLALPERTLDALARWGVLQLAASEGVQ